MDTLKQKAIQEYEDLMAEMQNVRQGIDLLPDGLDAIGAEIYGNTMSSIRIDIPMTPTAFEEIRRILGPDWKRNPAGYEYQANDGYRFFSFVHRQAGIELRVCLRTDITGATCQRKQIGTKEIPIFETICQ